MKSVAILFAGFLLAGSAAYAQQLSAGSADLLTSVPQSSRTVTDWYKQNVYDPNNNKIGEITGRSGGTERPGKRCYRGHRRISWDRGKGHCRQV